MHFEYQGQQYTGCAAPIHGRKPWCSTVSSLSKRFDDRWEYCSPCVDEVSTAGNQAAAEAWQAVSKKIQCLTAVAVTVGTASGRVFASGDQYGKKKLEEPTAMASGSKWPVALAVFAAAKHNWMDLATRASDVFSWWKKDGSPKSKVTLWNLLHFDSGFYARWVVMHADPQISCMNKGSEGVTLEDCAREIYEKSAYHGEPGLQWDYNSMHLQLALAMVAKRTNMTASQLLRRYVLSPAKMERTYFDPQSNELNPMVAAGMHAPGYEYDSFLRKYLANELLPEEWTQQFEEPVIKTSWGDDFAVSHMINGDEHLWGGTIMAIVNRKKGYYALLMLPYLDYMTGGTLRALAWGWIKEDVEHALSYST